MKRENLTGFVFDKLLAIELLSTGNKYPSYKCQCECGKYVEVSAKYLKTKNKRVVKSCGCDTYIGYKVLNLKNQTNEDRILYTFQKLYKSLLFKIKTNEKYTIITNTSFNEFVNLSKNPCFTVV